MLERKAGSVGEIISAAREITTQFGLDSTGTEVWYRGHGSAHESLQPSLYRPETQRYRYDETTLVEEFRALSAQLTDSKPADDWEWYFLARHHGLPSRLLDWSEGILPALYFALRPNVPVDRPAFEDALRRPAAEPTFDLDGPCIWVLEAASLNVASKNEDLVYIPGGPSTADYLTSAMASPSAGTLPLAIYPPRANRRIVAQQGVFTVHGTDMRSLDELAKGNPQIKLGRILLDRSRIPHMYEELEMLGVSALTLFPDLDNVARHVCWRQQPSTA